MQYNPHNLLEEILGDDYNDIELVEKLINANGKVSNHVRNTYKKGSWRYIDFVNEGRFFYEIISDGFDIKNHTEEEISEYAIEQIES